MSDIDKADVFVLLSDDGPTRGGKHFETGYAAARKVIPIFVIGHSEIMQHSLPIVDVLPDTEALYVKLEEWNQ